MDKKKALTLNLIFGLLYHVFGSIGFFLLFFMAGFDGVIQYVSQELFWFCFLILPGVVLVMPVILYLLLKKEFYQSVLLSLISILLYFAAIGFLHIGIVSNMKEFTPEKWNDNNNLRYLMVEDMENQYAFVGMKKREVQELLGDQEEYNNRLTYYIKSRWLTSYYYCLDLDESDTVTKTYIEKD